MILLCLISSKLAFADLHGTEHLQHPLEATSRILNLLAVDAPLPLDDAKKGEWKVSASPTYFKVDQLFYSNEGDGRGTDLQGDGLNGYALYSAYGKALNDRWQFFGMINGVHNRGRIIHKLGAENTSHP